jgi:SnoaL-like domain
VSERTGSAESNRAFMGDYFRVMSADGDLAPFFTEDVTWVNVESGQQFRGRAAVRDYIKALHDRLYEARSQGRSLDVTDAHAFLEGDFVGTSSDVRVPFCLVYDLGDAGISAMRAYMSFGSLPVRVPEAAGEPVPEHLG